MEEYQSGLEGMNAMEGAAAAGIGMGVILFYAAIIILMIVSMWKIFTKAGEEGWKAIVPIYNIVILLKISGKPAWWVLLWLIPFANYVFIIWTYNMLAKSFGKTSGFTVGLVLLGIVFFPILAFGSAKYVGPGGQAAGGDGTELDAAQTV